MGVLVFHMSDSYHMGLVHEIIYLIVISLCFGFAKSSVAPLKKQVSLHLQPYKWKAKKGQKRQTEPPRVLDKPKIKTGECKIVIVYHPKPLFLVDTIKNTFGIDEGPCMSFGLY